MRLSRTERWILSNQFRILEALYPEEAKNLAEQRIALERGYELHYDWLCEYIWDDDAVLTSEECREILDILTMFSSLQRGYEALADRNSIEERRIRFRGFDGNSETAQMAYAEYYCGQDGGRYQDLNLGGDFNSHMPMLDIYRRMLAAWRASECTHDLTADDICRILTAC
jgi:uncharacterized protein YfbU (UPF0304 family)